MVSNTSLLDYLVKCFLIMNNCIRAAGTHYETRIGVIYFHERPQVINYNFVKFDYHWSTCVVGVALWRNMGNQTG